MISLHILQICVALVIGGLSICVLGVVYCILEPFIKSLLWALLVGSVLYQFKWKLVQFTQKWIEGVKCSKVPFVVHVALSPLKIVDCISDQIGDYVTNYWKSIGSGSTLFFITYLIYYNPPVTLGLILKWIVTTLYSIFYTGLACVRSEIVFGLIIGYFGVILHKIIVR